VVLRAVRSSGIARMMLIRFRQHCLP